MLACSIDVDLNYYKIHLNDIFDSIKIEHEINICRVYLTLYIQNTQLCLLRTTQKGYALSAYNVHVTNIEAPPSKFSVLHPVDKFWSQELKGCSRHTWLKV